MLFCQNNNHNDENFLINIRGFHVRIFLYLMTAGCCLSGLLKSFNFAIQCENGRGGGQVGGFVNSYFNILLIGRYRNEPDF